MDDLKITIDTLSADDKRAFLVFMKRQKRKKHRKDEQLFLLLQQKKKYTPQQLQESLYPGEQSSVAYYALRKRLMRQLSDFIVLKQLEEDPTAASAVMSLVSLAKYLFGVQADRLAWNLLRKAEKQAAEAEQYDLLNTIYNIQIEKADLETADDLEEIIRKRNENKTAADEDERANIAASLIRKKLAQVRMQGRDMHFDAIIKQVLQEYQLTEAVSKRPSLFHKLMVIARSAVLARKDFYQFEPYILSQYRLLESRHTFTKTHLHYKLNLLYMIAHVLYRNRKFRQSLQYLDQLYADLQHNSKMMYSRFYARYIFLRSANLAFMKRLEEATKLMEELLSAGAPTLGSRDELTAQLSLSFFYFAQNNFAKANLLLLRMPYSDTICEKKMGKEWVLKKNLGELIIQIELQNPDLALNKLRTIERTFAGLLKQEAYANVRGFLQLLKLLLNQPWLSVQQQFLEMIEQQLAFLPLEQEDLQAISFYAWIKARTQRKPYYDTLLELPSTGVFPEQVE